MQQTSSTHRSLHRAVAILREFTETEPALTVGEISDRLDLHKSTVSRILGALLEEGMVWHNPQTGRYSLGMSVLEMAGVALGQIDVRAAALPHMEQLGATTSETIALVVRRDREGVTVAHIPSTLPIRHVVWIGRRVPLRTTAAGKVFLAALHSRGEDWRGLAGNPGEVRSPEQDERLGAELADIAERGYASEENEFEQGTAAIAAPIVDRTGIPIAALSISGPAARFDSEARDAAAMPLIDEAAGIAADLDGRSNQVLAEDQRQAG